MNQNELKVSQSGMEAGIFAMGEYDPRLDQWKSSSFDPRTLWDRLDGDADLLRELVNVFIEEYPALLDGIAAGIENQSFDDVRKFSHKLKGSALQFSGTAAVQLAASLEKMGQDRSLQSAGETFASLQKEVANLVESLQSISAVRKQ